jgi:hypothetical protein
MSNRKAFAATMRPMPISIERGASAQNASNMVEPMSYPPSSFPGSGPYIRNYSVRGVNAALGYASPKCSDVFLAAGDGANIYFGGIGREDITNDNAIDAGLQFNSDTSIQPFVKLSNSGYWHQGWTQEGRHYTCQQSIGIMYGILDGIHSVLMTGVPNYSPRQYEIPPLSSTWTQGAWTFFNTPLAFNQQGVWNGYNTMCTSCMTKRMVSISQPYDRFSDSSCFQGCFGRISMRWDQVVMGQLIQPCNQNPNVSATCTIQFFTDNRWYGGIQQYPDHGAGIFYADTDVHNGYEGLNLDPRYSNSSYSDLPADGSFGTLPPAPPDCTVDSYGYCAENSGNSTDGTISCWDGISHWHNFPATMTTSYSVYGSSGYIETATETTTNYDGGDGACPSTDTSWDPQEPSQQFGDPNLP